MAEIPLTKGYVALVDDDLFDWLSQWKWHALLNSRGMPYAARAIRYAGALHKVLMHRQILAAPPGVLGDHRDGDTLNNRRSNLRLADFAENARNRRHIVGKTGYRGVLAPNLAYRKPNYQAQIKVAGRTINLGTAPTAEEAARLYDAAALQHFGDFAVLNFPEEAGS